MKCARIAVGCVALAVALGAGPAAAQDDEQEEPSSFSRTNDLRGKTVRMDDLKNERPASLDEEVGGETSSLDSFQGGGSRSIEQTLEHNRGWQPPPCDPAPRAESGTPADDDLDGWELALGKAEKELENSQQRWQKLELGAVRVRVEDRSRQAEINREARDQSRNAYAKARCDLVDRLFQARSAGVPPGTLRPYFQRLPEDLRP